MSDTAPFTTNEAADRLGVDRQIAYGLIRFFLERGVVEECGTRKEVGAKGKGSTMYQLKEDASSKMTEAIDALRK
jgi:predicted ArsR family transcriptional regulator